MDQNYTHLLFVLDRSGSMAGMLDDMIGGINALVGQQATEPGRCTCTMVQFDSEYEELSIMEDIRIVQPRTRQNFIPRGGTALRDAIGKAVANDRQRIEALEESKRPALVMMIVVTDGFENASREWTGAALSQLMDTVKGELGWKVSFLGAGLEVAMQGQYIGTAGAVANFASGKLGDAYASVSDKMSASRGIVRGMNAEVFGSYVGNDSDSHALVDAALGFMPDELEELAKPVDKS